MRILFMSVLFLYFCFPLEVFSINKAALAKYPYPLLTDDYGLLDENDLGGYTWDMNQEPFSGKITGLKYWQCFETSKVSFHYEYEESDYREANEKDAYVFSVKVKSDKDKIQEYVRARLIPKDFCETIKSDWKKLINGQKYVCLGGSFIDRTVMKIKRKEMEVITWSFDKIKTKKGCDSYFETRGRSFCGMTQEEFERPL